MIFGYIMDEIQTNYNSQYYDLTLSIKGLSFILIKSVREYLKIKIDAWNIYVNYMNNS